MDKLAKQLRADAAMIDVHVSDELERRIAASLQSVTPEVPEPSAVRHRPAAFWWASSLTGIAAALAVIAIMNSGPEPASEQQPQVVAISPIPGLLTPTIEWQTESAMLTRPLRKELDDLQADIRKVEEKVKRDIGL